MSSSFHDWLAMETVRHISDIFHINDYNEMPVSAYSPQTDTLAVTWAGFTVKIPNVSLFRVESQPATRISRVLMTDIVLPQLLPNGY